MKKELQNKLMKKHSKILESVAYGLSVDDGWYKLIDQLCTQIQEIVDEKNLPQVKAVQVKEKFGGLRFYTNHTNEEIRLLIREAENASYRTCEVCGKNGTPSNKGWIRTLCAEHDS